jgi:LPXTG-motif cell wall-anchored protein
MKSRGNSRLKQFLGTTVLTFLLLVLLGAGLPALLMLLDVPPFAIGDRAFWLLRWQNDTAGSSITFNWLPLLGLAIVLGTLAVLLRRSQRSEEQKSE